MNLSRVLQNLLLRDALSYGVPGVVALVAPFALHEEAAEALSSAFATAQGAIGDVLKVGIALALVYAFGYVAAVIGWMVEGLWDLSSALISPSWKFLGWFYVLPPKLPERAEQEIQAHFTGLEKLSGSPDDLQVACLAAVQARDPQWFDMNIERQWQISNMELGLVGAGVVWIVALGLVSSPWWAFAVVALLTLALLRSRKEQLNYIRSLAFHSFFTIVKGGIARIGTEDE